MENRGDMPINLSDIDMNIISLFLNTSWQNAKLIRVSVNGSSASYKLSLDIDGNPIIMLEPIILRPGSSINISYVQEVTEYYPRRSGLALNPSEELLRGNTLWQVNDADLQSLAFRVCNGTKDDMEKLLSLVKWIHDNIRYGGEMPPRYPKEVYLARSGDCDEQAMLLITLCRIVGIPAFMQLGCVYMPNFRETSTFYDDHVSIELINLGWHAWVQAYTRKAGWLPVDLTFYARRTGTVLDLIEGAAIRNKGTLVLAHVYNYDYVHDARRLKELLESYNLRIIERDELIPKGGRVILRPGLTVLSAISSAIILTIVLIILARKEFIRTPTSNVMSASL